MGVWVDPDTGHWYGLVHNEFTPQPFGDGLHYDAIDYAVSKDQGKTWNIKDHVLTSPYSTKRGDNTAFPHDTYHYGNGDARLFVDTASGYFYVYYNSRVIPKGGVPGAWTDGSRAHVARAPMSAKLAPGSWKKWYDGAWSQPGIGGLESNMEPVDTDHTTGYTPVEHDYDPATEGSVQEQQAAGELPAKSRPVDHEHRVRRLPGQVHRPARGPRPGQHPTAALLRHRRPLHPEVGADRRHRRLPAPDPGTAGCWTR